MNRIKKELFKRGIIGDNEIDVITGRSSVEWEAKLIAVTKNFIIIGSYTNVLDPMFRILDKNLNVIAEQAIWFDNMEHWNFGNYNPWDARVF